MPQRATKTVFDDNVSGTTNDDNDDVRGENRDLTLPCASFDISIDMGLLWTVLCQYWKVGQARMTHTRTTRADKATEVCCYHKVCNATSVVDM